MMRLSPIRYGVKYIDTGDPYAANVISLLHMDGTNNQTSNFVDEVTGTGAWTYHENLLRTAAAKFGTTGFLQGVGWNGAPEYVTASVGEKSLSAWNNENNWTQEGWYKYDVGAPGSGEFTFFSLRNTSVNGAYVSVSTSGTGRIMSLFVTGSSVSTGIAVPTDALHFFQMISNGTTVVLAMDGVQIASIVRNETVSDGYAIWSPAHNSQIGGYTATGYWDEMRLTKGIARPISLPTGAFPNP